MLNLVNYYRRKYKGNSAARRLAVAYYELVTLEIEEVEQREMQRAEQVINAEDYLGIYSDSKCTYLLSKEEACLLILFELEYIIDDILIHGMNRYSLIIKPY